MKIKVPDDDELFERLESERNNQPKEPKTPLQDEIKEIMKLPKLRSSLIVDRIVVGDTVEDRLQMLLNFTQFCREEVFPRQAKAFETLQSRSDGLQCQLACQQQDITHMLSLGEELQQNLLKLEAKQTQAQAKQQELITRLKYTLGKLQDCCKNKTEGEEKTAQEIKALERKVSLLKKHLQETSSKANYFTTQVKVQSDSARKYIKPLYLDKNRTVFLRSSLNSMRLNIEDLIRRLKALKNLASELSDPGESQKSS